MGPRSHDWYLHKERDLKTRDRQRDNGHVKMAVETGQMQLKSRNAKDHQQPPEALKRQRTVLPRASEGARPCQHLDFGFLVS